MTTTKTTSTTANSSSFRDPSGFVFEKNGKIFRQVNFVYKSDYDLLKSSGLYEKLVEKKLLIPHKELTIHQDSTGAYKQLEPEKITFISYPYEWSFSMLRDAAILTLRIQRIALNYGMSLKDATSFNVQFQNGRPIFIDTLSFEKYKVGTPWIAYKQFCEQFLAPLALMSQRDIRLNTLLSTGLGSIPLDLAAKLLPFKSRLNFSLFLHLFSHSKSQQKHSASSLKTIPQKHFSQTSLLGLISNLESGIKSLSLPNQKTTWSNYYEETNYNDSSFLEKGALVSQFLDLTNSKYVYDFGANNGFFSRIASKKAHYVISLDNDPLTVEQNYINLQQGEGRQRNILPLLIDLTSPSAEIGWANSERDSFLNRMEKDTILALALIHHLAIANNLPLEQIAEMFSSHCKFLIIEFVPKVDSQVQVLLQSREDIFPNYSQANFEKQFSKYFTFKKSTVISGTKRTLYLMFKK